MHSPSVLYGGPGRSLGSTPVRSPAIGNNALATNSTPPALSSSSHLYRSPQPVAGPAGRSTPNSSKSIIVHRTLQDDALFATPKQQRTSVRGSEQEVTPQGHRHQHHETTTVGGGMQSPPPASNMPSRSGEALAFYNTSAASPQQGAHDVNGDQQHTATGGSLFHAPISTITRSIFGSITPERPTAPQHRGAGGVQQEDHLATDTTVPDANHPYQRHVSNARLSIHSLGGAGQLPAANAITASGTSSSAAAAVAHARMVVSPTGGDNQNLARMRNGLLSPGGGGGDAQSPPVQAPSQQQVGKTKPRNFYDDVESPTDAYRRSLVQGAHEFVKTAAVLDQHNAASNSPPSTAPAASASYEVTARKASASPPRPQTMMSTPQAQRQSSKRRPMDATPATATSVPTASTAPSSSYDPTDSMSVIAAESRHLVNVLTEKNLLMERRCTKISDELMEVMKERDALVAEVEGLRAAREENDSRQDVQHQKAMEGAAERIDALALELQEAKHVIADRETKMHNLHTELQDAHQKREDTKTSHTIFMDQQHRMLVITALQLEEAHQREALLSEYFTTVSDLSRYHTGTILDEHQLLVEQLTTVSARVEECNGKPTAVGGAAINEEDVVATLQTSHDAALEDERRKYEALLASTKQEHTTQVDALKLHQKEHQAAIQAECQHALQTQRTAHDARLAEEKDRYQQLLLRFSSVEVEKLKLATTTTEGAYGSSTAAAAVLVSSLGELQAGLEEAIHTLEVLVPADL